VFCYAVVISICSGVVRGVEVVEKHMKSSQILTENPDKYIPDPLFKLQKITKM